MSKFLQHVIFSMGGEHYGIGIDMIQEIVRVPEITSVPDSPDFLDGVINLRGRIIPVIDLRKKLRMGGTGQTKSSRVLILGQSAGSTGLLVDSVSEVLKIRPESIENPPEIISAVGVEYIPGVAKIEGRLIILLDIRKILDISGLGTVPASGAATEAEAA